MYWIMDLEIFRDIVSMSTPASNVLICLPEDVLSLIIDACIPLFGLLIQPEIISISSWPLHDEWSGQFVVEGLPDLANIKLVCRLFRDLVSTRLTQKFSGRLEADNIYEDCNEDVLLGYVNKLFAGRLSCLSPRVTTFYVWVRDQRVINGLCVENFPTLRTIQLQPDLPEEHRWLLWDNDTENALDEVLAGNADDKVLPYIADAIREHLPEPSLLRALRERGTRLVFRYWFEISERYASIFYVDCTDPEHPFIDRRLSDSGKTCYEGDD